MDDTYFYSERVTTTIEIHNIYPNRFVPPPTVRYEDLGPGKGRRQVKLYATLEGQEQYQPVRQNAKSRLQICEKFVKNQCTNGYWCVYMHAFPCPYYYTGLRCPTSTESKNCKFIHGGALPKNILGAFRKQVLSMSPLASGCNFLDNLYTNYTKDELAEKIEQTNINLWEESYPYNNASPPSKPIEESLDFLSTETLQHLKRWRVTTAAEILNLPNWQLLTLGLDHGDIINCLNAAMGLQSQPNKANQQVPMVRLEYKPPLSNGEMFNTNETNIDVSNDVAAADQCGIDLSTPIKAEILQPLNLFNGDETPNDQSPVTKNDLVQDDAILNKAGREECGTIVPKVKSNTTTLAKMSSEKLAKPTAILKNTFKKKKTLHPHYDRKSSLRNWKNLYGNFTIDTNNDVTPADLITTSTSTTNVNEVAKSRSVLSDAINLPNNAAVLSSSSNSTQYFEEGTTTKEDILNSADESLKDLERKLDVRHKYINSSNFSTSVRLKKMKKFEKEIKAMANKIRQNHHKSTVSKLKAINDSGKNSSEKLIKAAEKKHVCEKPKIKKIEPIEKMTKKHLIAKAEDKSQQIDKKIDEIDTNKKAEIKAEDQINQINAMVNCPNNGEKKKLTTKRKQTITTENAEKKPIPRNISQIKKRRICEKSAISKETEKELGKKNIALNKDEKIEKKATKFTKPLLQPLEVVQLSQLPIQSKALPIISQAPELVNRASMQNSKPEASLNLKNIQNIEKEIEKKAVVELLEVAQPTTRQGDSAIACESKELTKSFNDPVDIYDFFNEELQMESKLLPKTFQPFKLANRASSDESLLASKKARNAGVGSGWKPLFFGNNWETTNTNKHECFDYNKDHSHLTSFKSSELSLNTSSNNRFAVVKSSTPIQHGGHENSANSGCFSNRFSRTSAKNISEISFDEKCNSTSASHFKPAVTHSLWKLNEIDLSGIKTNEANYLHRLAVHNFNVDPRLAKFQNSLETNHNSDNTSVDVVKRMDYQNKSTLFKALRNLEWIQWMESLSPSSARFKTKTAYKLLRSLHSYHAMRARTGKIVQFNIRDCMNSSQLIQILRTLKLRVNQYGVLEADNAGH